MQVRTLEDDRAALMCVVYLSSEKTKRNLVALILEIAPVIRINLSELSLLSLAVFTSGTGHLYCTLFTVASPLDPPDFPQLDDQAELQAFVVVAT